MLINNGVKGRSSLSGPKQYSLQHVFDDAARALHRAHGSSVSWLLIVAIGAQSGNAVCDLLVKDGKNKRIIAHHVNGIGIASSHHKDGRSEVYERGTDAVFLVHENRPGQDDNVVTIQIAERSGSSFGTKLKAKLEALASKMDCDAIVESQLRSTVHVLIHDVNGLHAEPLGVIGDENAIQPLNYTTEQMEAFHGICSSLSARNPTGRLTILNGPPGTGKSFFIRGIVHAAKRCDFLLIHASALQSLSGPSVLPMLMGRRRDGFPIVLIVEDADLILARRGADNMSEIGAILNMSDGILGEMLDLRIIATTNATKNDYDPAVMRSGRLLCHLDMPRLSAEMAEKIMRRLLGDKFSDGLLGKIGYSLADLYAIAAQNGYEPDRGSNTDSAKQHSFGSPLRVDRRIGYDLDE